MVRTIEAINAKYGKLPPQAIDLEEAIIAACILDREAVEMAVSYLAEACFYKNEHQIIFEAIKTLYAKAKPVDHLTLTNELRANDKLEVVGGLLEIMRIGSVISTAAHIEFHCQIVKQKFISREVIRIANELETSAYDETTDIADTIDLMEKHLDALHNSFTGGEEGKTTRNVARVTLREIEEDAKKTAEKKLVGIDTGLYSLNKATGGWRSPNFILIAARPSTGKTSLMLHFIIAAAKAGHWVNVYGFEMVASDLFRIVLSGEADIKRTKVRDGNLTTDDWKDLNNAVGRIEDLPIIWYDSADIKANRIKANTKRNRKNGKCEIVFVDYLQIVPPEDEKQVRETQISKISRTLKSITLNDKIPVVALAQLNRDVDRRTKGSKPVLADLRESGALEQDSDIVIFPYRTEEGNFNLNIAKHRRGKVGDVPIIANEEMTRFTDPVPDEYRAEIDLTNRYEKDPF